MIYCGIDTSTVASPYAIFDDKKLIAYGVLPIEGKFLEDKIYKAYENIDKLAKDYNVDVFIFEDVYIGVNAVTAKSTLQVLGAMRLSAYHHKATCFTVQVAKWRKGVITGKTRADKKKCAIDYVNEMYGLDLVYHSSRTKTDDDMAECIVMVEGLVWGRYTLENVKVFGKG